MAKIPPAFEVIETEDDFVFKAEVPGIKPSDVDVTLSGTRLVITGRTDIELQETGAFHCFERTYGGFLRTFSLPHAIDHDHVRTRVVNGVLTVSVPKTA